MIRKFVLRLKLLNSPKSRSCGTLLIEVMLMMILLLKKMADILSLEMARAVVTIKATMR